MWPVPLLLVAFQATPACMGEFVLQFLDDEQQALYENSGHFHAALEEQIGSEECGLAALVERFERMLGANFEFSPVRPRVNKLNL